MEEIKKDENQEDVKNSKNNKKELEKIKALIETQKKEIEEKDDRLKRLMAEFENFKKRSSKEREGLYNSLIADITSSLLPILDNLEKAVQVKTEDENFKQGIELVLKQFKDVLTSNGVTEIETIGKTFDPELHEAITSVVDENGKFIGLVTDGDIRRMLARGAEFLDEPVEDLMTKNPVIITKDKMAAEALSIMEKHQPKPITVLPVIDVEKNEPVGIVHLTDLLRQGVV